MAGQAELAAVILGGGVMPQSREKVACSLLSGWSG